LWTELTPLHVIFPALVQELEFGLIGINNAGLSAATTPFGGVKQSGIGREGGHWGLDEYLEVKYVGIGK
jgi:succinate-semialdehyde dehydrogenase / glutarate-semialdehyde dehydrogenase